jgi:hypothetical protein
MRVDRFWVNRFMGHNIATLNLHQAIFREEDIHDGITDDTKRYFDQAQNRMRTFPSTVVGNTDQTKVGSLKRQQVVIITIFIGTGPGLVTVPESRDDSQITLPTTISAFGSPIPLLLLSKNKRFKKNRLAR